MKGHKVKVHLLVFLLFCIKLISIIFLPQTQCYRQHLKGTSIKTEPALYIGGNKLGTLGSSSMYCFLSKFKYVCKILFCSEPVVLTENTWTGPKIKPV
ncbi:hypothetical protein XENTR_v10008951 [Xenopus tropicalis]|nr:hypothetical protein XENTR_v10008951 [Xenopus tropicalis]